ncbi:eukaryotic aspartyl protease [Colletotrichum navitas]|uniref:Eukaryotic aspartyl protease n=1 Tax=Colletotrichum navitas TaxID=681940 RepID=A0AAD8PWD2_9PEZI|nr:eukaryotic aspartyl protease [Colletotrichum navitas]KAK1585330.1 eukaryotic aspartyl protease [Colletotrichum navitas]
MRLCRAFALLAVTHEGASQKVVSASFHRVQFPPDLEQMTRRDTPSLAAINNITGGGYYSTVQVGTPGQKAMVQIDTGSSDTWILDNQADLCSSRSLQRQYGTGCTESFNSSMSSTFKLVSANDFDVAYLDGKRIRGDYIQDVVSFGGKTIKDQQLGLAVQTVRAAGLLGLGLTGGTTSKREYPTILDNMVKQGQIGRKAYSIWLNDLSSAEGIILFGGVDTEKYIGKLTTLPLVNDYQTGKATSYSVALTGVAIEAPGQKAVEMAAAAAGGGSFNASTVLDSGATVCLLPDRLAKDIWAKYGVLDRGYGVLDCAWRGPQGEGHVVEFEFAGGGGVRIRVPLEEMVLDSLGGVAQGGSVPFDRPCLFGIQSSATFGVEGDGFALLGDTFLRSAYVVYDEANRQIGIAQANLNASRSHVIELRANETALPTATGPAGGDADTTSPPVMTTTTTTAAGESAAPTASESANAAAPRGGATSWGPGGSFVTSFVSVFAAAGAVLLAV